MARLFLPRAGADLPGAAVPRRRTSTAGHVCDSYSPGHQMHYIQQGRALRSPSLPARHVALDGERLVVVPAQGEQLDWRHHDPQRLADVLGLFPHSRVAYPAFHALRVGPYWFNCASGVLAPCETRA